MGDLTKRATVNVAAILGLLLFLVVGQSVADSDNSPLAQIAALHAQVSALEEDRDALTARVEALEEGAGDLGAVQQSVETLQDLLAHLSRDGNDIFITGANLHVVNGLGGTETTNGLGNVIIGYNESRAPSGTDDRSGSHMLVAGSKNNYSGYGGIVVGDTNTTSGAYSSVSGGSDNTASEDYSSVSGGVDNRATGFSSSVSGGRNNTASNFSSSVSGGRNNRARGFYASVSGGDGTTADDTDEHPNTHD